MKGTMKKLIFICLILITVNANACTVWVDGQCNEGHIIQNDGTTMRQQPILNFKGTAITTIENSGSKTEITIDQSGSVHNPVTLAATSDTILTLNNQELALGDVWTEAENTAAGYISSETDDQTIDVFSVAGDNVQLSLEDDGEATKTVDISTTTAVTANTAKVTDDDDGVDGAYGAGWDGDTDSPEKDDIYDAFLATPQGELGGTWASPTVDSGIHDDEYVLESGDTMTGILDMDNQGLTNIYQQVVTVAKAGGDYDVIQDAVDSITDNATDKRYTILIHPGTYTENVVMEEYVSLVGFDHETTHITSASGTTVTAPPGTSDALIMNIKLSSTPTADGAIVLAMTDGELDIYNTYLKMTSSTNGVRGNLLSQTGGDIEFNHTLFKYDLDGTSAGSETHSVILISGTDVYHIYDSEFVINVDDVDDIVVGINEASGATITAGIVKNMIMHISLNHASFSGAAGAFYLHGTGTDKQIENCHIDLQSAGNGTGYIFYMDTSAGGGLINALTNRGVVEGFANNYAGNVAAGDTLNGAFVSLDAADGFTGAGTKAVVSSSAYGDLTATGTINGTTITEGGNAVYNATETPGGELGGTWASPTVDATHSGSAHHASVTLAGQDYLTLSTQQITATVLNDDDVSNTLTASDLVAGGSVVADAEVDNDITIDLATLATTVTVSDDEATNDAHELVFTTDNTNLESDGDFHYSPDKGLVTATGFAGALTGNVTGDVSGNAGTATLASTVVVIDGTDTTSFPAIFDSATGSLPVKTDGGLTYNAGTANLAATTFTGALAGNATTATDLAANGANCGAGEVPAGVDTKGAVESCDATPAIDCTDCTNVHSALSLLTAETDALSATTEEAGGLEYVDTDKLSLLQGCNGGQGLFWNETNDYWKCAYAIKAYSADLQTYLDTTSNPDKLTMGVGGGDVMILDADYLWVEKPLYVGTTQDVGDYLFRVDDDDSGLTYFEVADSGATSIGMATSDDAKLTVGWTLADLDADVTTGAYAINARNTFIGDTNTSKFSIGTNTGVSVATESSADYTGALAGLLVSNTHEGTGVVSTQYGLNVSAGVAGTSNSEVTDTYLIFAEVDGASTGSPTIDNVYQLFLADPSTATVAITNYWGIYQEDGDASNFFAGDIQLDSDSNKLQLGADQDFDLYSDGTDSYIDSNTGDLKFIAAGGDADFADDNITTTATITGEQLSSTDDATLQDDLFLDSDGATIQLGESQDVIITHVADTGILMALDDYISFGDAAVYIESDDDGYLDFVADTGLRIDADSDITGSLIVDGDTDATQMTVQAHSTQNNDIFRVEDSAANPVFVVDEDGHIGILGNEASSNFALYAQASGSLRGSLYFDYTYTSGSSASNILSFATLETDIASNYSILSRIKLNNDSAGTNSFYNLSAAIGVDTDISLSAGTVQNMYGVSVIHSQGIANAGSDAATVNNYGLHVAEFKQYDGSITTNNYGVFSNEAIVVPQDVGIYLEGTAGSALADTKIEYSSAGTDLDIDVDGTEALSIDTDGLRTTGMVSKYGYYFAYASAEIAGVVAETILDLDTVVIEDSDYYSESGGSVTIQKDGLYKIGFTVNFDQDLATRYWAYAGVSVGGTVLEYSKCASYTRISTNPGTSCSNEIIVSLNAAQVVALEAWVQNVEVDIGGTFTNPANMRMEYIRDDS